MKGSEKKYSGGILRRNIRPGGLWWLGMLGNVTGVHEIPGECESSKLWRMFVTSPFLI